MFQTLLIALVVTAPAPKDAPKKEAPTLVGKWQMAAVVMGGKPEELPAGSTLEFTADGKCVAMEGAMAKPDDATYTADPKKDPPEIDIIEPRAGGKGRPILGIYRFEGETLTVVFSEKGDRPTAFESPAGSRVVMMTLKRMKKD